MKLKTFIPIIALALLLGGCSGKLTVIDFGQEGKAEAGKDGTSGKVINFLVLYTPGATLSTVTEQTTDGQVPISLYGANSATGSQDNPNAVFNPVSIVKEVIDTIVPAAVPEKVEVLDNDDASGFEPLVYELRQEGNKSFTWMKVPNFIDHSGPMTFTFDGGCGVLKVPDVKHIWGEDGNPKNHGQRFYFSGNPKEQKDFNDKGNPTGNPYGSVFTAPGCAAKTVTVTRG